MAEPRATRWRIGPSGWSYPDWEALVYPARKPRGFKPLACIASMFDAVEVNSSFYAIPAPRVTQNWARLTPPDFRFTVKLPQSFTHARPLRVDPREVDAFRAALEPLAASGKLGPLLIQFPWSFRHTPDAGEHLERLAGAFAAYPRFVEVRHSSWSAPQAQDTVRAAGGFCNIDQPPLRDCLAPSAHVSGRSAYVRLHGRNAANWFADGLPAFERYNYLYDETELREWVARLLAIGAQADEVYVFANNHYRGQGVVNALEIGHLLGLPPACVSTELRSAYPRIAAITRAPPPRDQATLF